MRAEIERLESGGKPEDTPSQNGEEKPQQKTEPLKKESKSKDKGWILAVLMLVGIVAVLVGFLVWVISAGNSSTPTTYHASGSPRISSSGEVVTHVPPKSGNTTTTAKTKPETTPKRVLVKQAEPENGEILRYGKGYWQSY